MDVWYWLSHICLKIRLKKVPRDSFSCIELKDMSDDEAMFIKVAVLLTKG